MLTHKMPCTNRSTIKCIAPILAKYGMKKQKTMPAKFDSPNTSFVPYLVASNPPGICVVQCNQKKLPSTYPKKKIF